MPMEDLMHVNCGRRGRLIGRSLGVCCRQGFKDAFRERSFGCVGLVYPPLCSSVSRASRAAGVRCMAMTRMRTSASRMPRTSRTQPTSLGRGKRLYWIGPRAAGFGLINVTPSYTPTATAVVVEYYSHNRLLKIVTYKRSSRLPESSDPYLSGLTVVGRTVTSTGQLVVFGLTKGKLSASDAAGLSAVLKPVSDADIDRLPADWSTLYRDR